MATLFPLFRCFLAPGDKHMAERCLLPLHQADPFKDSLQELSSSIRTQVQCIHHQSLRFLVRFLINRPRREYGTSSKYGRHAEMEAHSAQIMGGRICSCWVSQHRSSGSICPASLDNCNSVSVRENRDGGCLRNYRPENSGSSRCLVKHL